MVLFIRDNECFEPRVKNYLKYFDENGVDYHVIAWNRNGTAVPDERITFFERRAEYGKRIANIPNKLLWMSFVALKIFKYRKKISVIHACDIDAVIPALVSGKILGKKVIWDIFDWISSLTGKGIAYKLVEALQNFAYKHSDYVILCEKEREAQAKSSNKSVLVLPNIPSGKTQYDSATLEMTAEQRKKYRFIVSYVGVFDKDRGLEILLESISKCPDILLNIAGFGVLDTLIREYADKFENICCFGRVDYSVGQAIMKNSDLIAAMYHLTSPLHRFAAPNKYYESLALGVPVITTEGTLVGSKVGQYDTGFVIGESFDALYNLFSTSNLKEQIEIKSNNCTRIWNEIYSTYFDDFMNNEYVNIIK